MTATIAISGCAAKSSAPVANATAPVENRIELCVIDTIAPGGMMTLSAIHVQETNDTLVLQAEGRVPIAEVVAGPKVWTKGSIQLSSTAGRLRFNPSGQPRTFAPDKITLLGVLSGLPVFANPADAAGMRPEIEALAASGVDLEQALRRRTTLRRGMARIRTLYVPTSLVNCTFQTLSRPQPRRR